jgi:hypothetical protein
LRREVILHDDFSATGRQADFLLRVVGEPYQWQETARFLLDSFFAEIERLLGFEAGQIAPQVVFFSQ